jgi:hypothetical protein
MLIKEMQMCPIASFRFLKYISCIFVLFCCVNILFAQKYPEILITYPEIWNIDGIDTQITQTAIYGNSLYTIHASVDFAPSDDVKSQTIAKSIARYAIKNGYLLNALKYNSYNSQMKILKDSIGIALVNQYDKSTLSEAGYRYHFTFNELFTSIPTQTEIKIPDSINASYIEGLLSSIIEIYNKKEYSQLIDLYSKTALLTVNHDNDTKIIELYKKMDQIQKDNNRNKIGAYLGSKNNQNGYLYYYPVKISLKKYNLEIPAYILLMLVEEPSGIGVYNISVNISNPDDFKYIN